MSSEKIKKRTFISKLKKDGRINDNFLNIVSDLTLEELIGIKIEMASRLFRGKLYGIPLWVSMPRITRESMLRVAINLCKTKTDTASFLGVTLEHLNNILRNYNLELE